MRVFIRLKCGKTALKRYIRKGNVWFHVEPVCLTNRIVISIVKVMKNYSVCRWQLKNLITSATYYDSVYVRKFFPKKGARE